MDTLHPHRAVVPPVPEETPRPLWSVMIPTYNCAKFLRTTLASVLAQDPGADVMQIEVIDDCSTQDDPAAVVAELGHGRVGFYRQPQNVGHTKNFETCLQRSRGKLIHLLHGDDCVRDGFYHKMQQAFEHPEIGAAFCRHIFIDENGHWQGLSSLEELNTGLLSDWLQRIAVKQCIQTPSIVVKRDVYESLGGFDHRLSWAEDWEMWVRIATRYQFWYETEPLALYRMHSASNSGRYIRTGENVRDLRRAIAVIKQSLPNNCADLSKKAREHYAFYAIDSAKKFAVTGDTEAAFQQMKQALLCNLSLPIARSALKLLLKLFYLKTLSSLRIAQSNVSSI